MGGQYVEYLKKHYFIINKLITGAYHIKQRVLGYTEKDYWGWEYAPISNVKIEGYDFWRNYFNDRNLWLRNERIYNLWGKEGLSLAGEYLEEIYQLCKAQGINLTLVIYPWPEHIKGKAINNLQSSYWKKFAKNHNIVLIDFFPLLIDLNKKEDVVTKYFIDGDVHFNEQGHRFVKGILMDYINKE